MTGCALASGCVIVLGAEVLPVYHWAVSFLLHIFQLLEEASVKLCVLTLLPFIAYSNQKDTEQPEDMIRSQCSEAIIVHTHAKLLEERETKCI